MQHRAQRTIARPAEVCGIGFLTGADVRLRFLPAEPNHGIAFLRTDCAAPAIPALVEYTVPRQRRTAIARHGLAVEMIEHVMAALAGLQVDNCLVELNAPDPPGGDGSSQAFADALCTAGVVMQGVLRKRLAIQCETSVGSDDGAQAIRAMPRAAAGLALEYTLDYGPNSPIAPQSCRFEITPESFLNDIVFARTFVLEAEAEALRAQGYGRRTTARDLLIFGPQGVIDNQLRVADECARHKVLDCIGDLALLGCDLWGVVDAWRTGHRLNAEIVRRLKRSHAEYCPADPIQHAA